MYKIDRRGGAGGVQKSYTRTGPTTFGVCPNYDFRTNDNVINVEKKNHNNVRVKNWESILWVEKLFIRVFVLILIHEDLCDKNVENIIISGKSPFSVSPLKIKSWVNFAECRWLLPTCANILFFVLDSSNRFYVVFSIKGGRNKL